MFVGHLGVGLALRTFEPRLNAGVLVFAALFSDVVLGVLVLVGVEQVHVPADFATLRYQTFTFPWSHSLVASMAWSTLAFGISHKVHKDARCAAFVTAAVFSHFLLDVVEHPGMPILGDASPKIGLGLWNVLGGALLAEFVLAMGGLSLWLVDTQDRPVGRRAGMTLLVMAITGMALVGQWTAKEAPSASFGAVTSLITIGVLCALVSVLDRPVTPLVSDPP